MMLSQCIRRVVLYEPVKEKKKKNWLAHLETAEL